MAYELNNNSGSLFTNDKKSKDSQPDWTGTWKDENGKEFWLSAWEKTSKQGKKFYSLSASEKTK